jgi:hypothetical protein
MDVCRECCVLIGRGLCDKLITRPEESYRLVRRCVWSRKPREWGGHDPRWVAAPHKNSSYLYREMILNVLPSSPSLFPCMGRRSSVCIATGYVLHGSWIWVPIGARFSSPVQIGSEVHPPSCILCTRSFPGVKLGAWRSYTSSLSRPSCLVMWWPLPLPFSFPWHI